MDLKQFVQWIGRIYETADSEIACDQLQALLPAYVDARVSGESPYSLYSQVLTHLTHCPDCGEVFENLYHIAALEAHGELPELAELLAELAPAPQPETEPEGGKKVSAIPA
ncbi:MAG: zf-HC2 domain-containing protein [Chloroflexi bacterium]|nr:zf-HC2 domain-containing protein [Chloroflexota bacterium]MCI0580302.1 zf-HC2 domain-containing protein [Chloroflexota bacterium]MCI0648079.1 zf-HC2 domain-containing protein [Chloroflexota bacterium]MCI0730910.1 zf-HC2 domain-containing protein [Chloroflexota bacterium]